MKRLIQKYAQFLLILPLMVMLTGCDVSSITSAISGANNVGDDSLMGGVDIEDDSNKEAEKKAPEAVNPDAKKNENASEDVIILSGKNTTLDIDSGGRVSPFVPYRERNLSYSSLNYGDLPIPPLSGEADENLSNLVSAKVTGILYDPKSPSAIINVLDDDYLVRPGDKIESFQISGISKDYVAIKTGSNVFRAKVGDIVDGEIYGSGVYNLGHKFSGARKPARKEDVFVFSTKKQSENTNTNHNGGVVDFNEMSLPPIPEIKAKKNNNNQGVPGADINVSPTPTSNTNGAIPVPKVTLKTQAGNIPLPLGNNNAVPSPPKKDAN